MSAPQTQVFEPAMAPAGQECIALENDVARAVILPGLGGRVWELEDRARRRQWVWHRDGVPLAPPPRGAAYDDVWAGGWEELFPNDAAETFEGRELPDHGEWWAAAWRVDRVTGGRTPMARLSAQLRVRGAWCTKEFVLAGETLLVSYRIENLERAPFHFLFKPHFAVAVSPRCRLLLPGGHVQPVEPGFGTLVPASGTHEWPYAGDVDLRRVPPPTSAAREFIAVDGTRDGWCGVVDDECRASLRLDYDPATLPFCWLFLAYGGWRDCYTAVLEPCTNFPKLLSRAAAGGHSPVLPAHGTFQTEMAIHLGGPFEDGLA